MVFLKIWILLSVWLCAAGWILSACHELNGTGYLAVLAMTSVAAALTRKYWLPSSGMAWPRWSKLWWRFRRPAPFFVLVIAALSLAAGLHDAPQNGDTNAYRIPRVMHWLGQSGWHWIRTEDSRQNIAGTGYEWLYAPLMILTRTDRWTFLPNLICYFLLPGIIFSFLRRMQVVPRVAWWWCWLLASGWCYALQSCSTNNDALATVYVLAAIDFALRARTSGRISDLWLSLLSASVMSAIKPTNVLLLLPCAVAVCASWRLLISRPILTVGVSVFCVLASFVPMAAVNWQHTGSWKGYVPEPGPPIWWHWGSIQELPSPFSFWGGMRILANILYLFVQNILPPFVPGASAWNAAMKHFTGTPIGSHFAMFEDFGMLRRTQNGATAGIGLCVTAVALVSLLATRSGGGAASLSRHFDLYFWLRWTPWLALLIFLSRVGTIETARLIDPFYVLLSTPLLVRPGLARLVRQGWWQRLVLLLMGLTVFWLCYIFGRQFIPETAINVLSERTHSKVFGVVKDYFQARSSVARCREFTSRHAAGEAKVGYATICGGCEPGMWLPLGGQHVERILPDDSPATVRAMGLHHIFLEDLALIEKNETLSQWLERFNARLVDELAFTRDPGTPLGHIYFVQLNDESNVPTVQK